MISYVYVINQLSIYMQKMLNYDNYIMFIINDNKNLFFNLLIIIIVFYHLKLLQMIMHEIHGLLRILIIFIGFIFRFILEGVIFFILRVGCCILFFLFVRYDRELIILYVFLLIGDPILWILWRYCTFGIGVIEIYVWAPYCTICGH
jgi:hypothetical protein